MRATAKGLSDEKGLQELEWRPSSCDKKALHLEWQQHQAGAAIKLEASCDPVVIQLVVIQSVVNIGLSSWRPVVVQPVVKIGDVLETLMLDQVDGLNDVLDNWNDTEEIGIELWFAVAIPEVASTKSSHTRVQERLVYTPYA